jgi:hypothetical protein
MTVGRPFDGRLSKLLRPRTVRVPARGTCRLAVAATIRASQGEAGARASRHRTRLRMADGRWLLLHAARLSGRDSLGQVAVVSSRPDRLTWRRYSSTATAVGARAAVAENALKGCSRWSSPPCWGSRRIWCATT